MYPQKVAHMAMRDIGEPIAVLLKYSLQSAVASALVDTMRDFDHTGRPETEIVFTDKQIPPRSYTRSAFQQVGVTLQRWYPASNWRV